MTKGNLKAAIYTRVSTEEQKRVGFSLEGQKEDLTAYAAQKGYEVYDYYTDSDSGKDFNRSDIQRLFIDMRNEKFDAIIVWKVDRISRKNSDVLRLIDEELKHRGMKLLVSTCDIDSSTSNGYMFISLLGTFAEYERSLIIERVSAGMEKKSKLGQWNGGALLGYNVIDKKLVVNEEESLIVKRIFELRAQGKGYKAIARDLNSRGYRTKKNSSFGINAVKTILENETYIGNVRWGRYRNWAALRRKGKDADYHVEKGIHEPIIDMDTWELVQQIATVNREAAVNEKNIKTDFLLSGILKCPECGSGTVMSKVKKRKDGYYYYYICQSYHTKGIEVCRPNVINKDWIEKSILEIIKELVAKRTIVDELVEEVNQNYIEENEEIVLQYEENKKRIVELEKELNKLDLDYRKGDITPKSYGRQTKNIELDIETLEEQVVEFERKNAVQKETISAEKVSELLKAFDQVFDQADMPSKKLLIRSLIKSIEVNLDRKSLKRIVFWNSEDSTIFSEIVLPQEPRRRTVP
ncbi:recombinase family protein [Ureibacillus chungkukjangi]|uniref:Site-specific DNA recombinase n=1 Tax=Ureibacillus chungkukjangi TaxID=1202712 RepID=A0A318TTA7_9BACL|nr:recombinase family protein [Ureibacillus chungkukjangi]PYF07894.1 site-specific DNA recombinase [Ureibacillus chungkukjangi]